MSRPSTPCQSLPGAYLSCNILAMLVWRRASSVLLLLLVIGAASAACGSNSTQQSAFVPVGDDAGLSDGTTPLPDGGTGTGDGSTLIGADDGGGGNADSATGFDVEPSTLQTLDGHARTDHPHDHVQGDLQRSAGERGLVGRSRQPRRDHGWGRLRSAP